MQSREHITQCPVLQTMGLAKRSKTVWSKMCTPSLSPNLNTPRRCLCLLVAHVSVRVTILLNPRYLSDLRFGRVSHTMTSIFTWSDKWPGWAVLIKATHWPTNGGSRQSRSAKKLGKMSWTHQSLGGGEKAKRMGYKQCSSALCFLRHSDCSFHLHAVFAMGLTLNDNWTELINASATCDEFKRLHSGKKVAYTIHSKPDKEHKLQLLERITRRYRNAFSTILSLVQ